MKHFFSLLFTCCLTLAINAQAQPKNTILNLDIETVVDGKAVGWTLFGNEKFTAVVDSTIVHGGKYSLSISNDSDVANFRAWNFTLPANYEGKRIKLSGYLKTENVTTGFAGLWMRIDPSIDFDNMQNKGIKGTNDWQKFEITLQMNPQETTQIVLGGLLVGKGKIWIDDLEIHIDRKELKNAKIFEKEKLPADLDTEFAQGSAIADFTPNATQLEHLKTLGLIWGFLKYHHPAIAKGNYNWDFELFRITPKILAAKTATERDMALLEWIKKLGEVKEGKPETFKPDEVKIKPDLDWLTQSGFSAELQNQLLKIKNADRSNKHYYIDFYAGVKNPIFQNENAYDDREYPDAGYRLLSLYRYWNMIQYYFPYKNLIEEDWKNVLQEFIPKAIAAKDKTDYTLTMLELIARIHDTHANIWGGNKILSDFWGKNYTAYKVKFIEEQAVVIDYYDETLAKENPLQKGDVILKVNDKEVTQIVKDLLKRTPASNYPTQLRDIGPKLLRSNDSLVTVTYQRNNEILTHTIKTYPRSKMNFNNAAESTEHSFKWLDQDILYIHNGDLKKNELPEIGKQMQKAKAVIIDDRNYPSDFPIFELSKLLLPQRNLFVKFSNSSLKTPGLFTYFGEGTYVGSNNSDYFKGKVIILVDETTQSSAEYHAMAYRTAPNATVMGSTTAGADGNVSSIKLPGGIMTMISGIGVYYPDGKETQRIGIVPDIVVKPTIEGFNKGKDEVLEKALAFIRKD
ncbi:S41 family peptidase [Flavobacterium sp. UBA7682]|uniref:S41 family peptidase n=1 Tax=Flavobacterium sp. UBA7682 TaxID=1946560 RepID=UPI0025BDF2E2|nr:S41 family peptidase [Flavobacterium sp. UBA7682]